MNRPLSGTVNDFSLARPFRLPMQILIAGVAGLAFAGCEGRRLGDPSATIILAVDLAVIRDAESGHGYLIDGLAAIENDDNVKTNATDYSVVKDLGAIPQDQTSDLLSVLLDPRTYEWENSKGCIVAPGVKLTFQADGHQVDLLFCLDCYVLLVYRDDQLVSSGNFDFGGPRLVDQLKSIFPDDPLIQPPALSE